MNGDQAGSVILGAGPLGTTLARQLQTQGERVRLLSVMNNPAYDMPGTRPESTDGADPAQVREACEGAGVIYLCLNAHYVDWYEKFPPVLHAVIEAASAVDARLVYADCVYMYGPVDGVLTEELPHTTKVRKGKLRGEMADAVLEAHNSGRVESVIGRAADMYGPGALNSSFGSTFGQRHFYPALDGNAMNLLGNVDAPHAYIFVDDFASGLMTLAAQDSAAGQVWLVPSAPTLSHRQLATIVFEEAGHAPKIRGSKISGYFVRVIGRFQPDVGEVAEMLYQFEKPFVVDHSKFEKAFGADPTPHQTAVRTTLDWYRQHPM